MPMLRTLLHRLSVALPSQCAICQSWPAQPVCQSCLGRFARPQPRCPGCAMPLPAGVTRCGTCLSAAPVIDLCLAAVPYEYPWSDLVARYKFGTSPGWSHALAELMRATPGAQAALQSAELLLPMPLSKQRLRERGFNQALELARQLDPHKTRSGLLLRLRDTPAQSSLAREARLRNGRGAFGLADGGAAALAGRNVMLIDDVMTSGASLGTAAAVVRAAGASHISALVLARTE